jgi:hypothetical protein
VEIVKIGLLIHQKRNIFHKMMKMLEKGGRREE